MRNSLAIRTLGACSLLFVLSCSGESPEAKRPVQLEGVGATFPAILYDDWLANYRKIQSEVGIQYSAEGSGAGVRAFLENRVDFGASDNGLTPEEAVKAKRGVLQIPTTVGMVAVVYNLPGIDHLRLSRKALADIFLGKITRWDDPELRKHNMGIQLPAREIIPVVRLDRSGTTFLFTNHLNAISPEWSKRHGATRMVDWPETVVRQPGNGEVGGMVKRTSHSIGYVDLSTALQGDLSIAYLENKAKKFVDPSFLQGARTLQEVPIPDDLRTFVPDPTGEAAYPIVGFTYLLLHREYEEPKRKAIYDFVTWCLTKGQERCEDKGYARLPSNVVDRALVKLAVLKPAGE